MLAVVWANQFDANGNLDVNNGFQAEYGDQAQIAQAIVNRAIDDWNSLILDYNYDNDNNPQTNNTLALEINAADLFGARGTTTITQLTTSAGGWDAGVPMNATITFDDDGGSGFLNDQTGPGDGWYFDLTVSDDAEFVGIVNSFQANFIDATQPTTNYNDFYRTIAHEIGHALGLSFFDSSSNLTRLTNFLTYSGTDQLQSTNDLWRFQNPAGQFGIVATFTEAGGAHFYEGPVDPFYPTAPTHPNDLLNSGRTVPAGQFGGIDPPIETTRQFISDLDVQVLADAYGYTLNQNLPRALNNAHVMLDSITGTLLVQGRARNFTTGAGVNDLITVERITDANGDDIRVTIQDGSPLGNIIERVPFDQVRDIIIHGNGGTDTITVNPNVTQSWQQVQYVVSSNEDALETSTSVGGSSTTNGIVDLSTVIPGSQTTLRAAIIEANAAGAARSIYVGRGIYNLTLSGTSGTAEGDLDITGHVTIVGAGAGATIIDSDVPYRVFVVNTNGAALNLSRLTVTGGNVTNSSGGGIYAQNSTTVTLNQVAIVDNHASSHGGGVFVGTGANVTIINSVITENTAGIYGGGILANAGSLSIGETIIAKNTATSSGNDIYGTATAVTSTGNNLLTSVHSTLTTKFNQPGDLISSTDYVVTSLVDSFDHTDDDYALSPREAIDLANEDDGHTSGTAETIWLPAWNFVLTRDRGTFGNDTPTDLSTDTDVAWGDLDIKDSLIIRGITASLTRVQWKPGVKDAVFDLLGDYDGNGLADSPDSGDVGGRDMLMWQRQFGQQNGIGVGQSSADGDDDGDVDGDDLTIWQNYYGNYLTLENLDEIPA